MHGEGDTGARPTARLDWDKNKNEPSNRAPDWSGCRQGAIIHELLQHTLNSKTDRATTRPTKTSEDYA